MNDPGVSRPTFTGIKVEVRRCSDLADNSVIPDLRPDVVDVWICSLEVSPPIERICYELLSLEERERAARYRIGKPREDFILTRGTLRSLLSRYLGATPQELSFRYSAYGKPFLDRHCDLRFNVSHSGGLALMAFAREREIGIDVEKVDREVDAKKLSERFFSVRERQCLKDLSGEELQSAFFRCWTRKEAYVKARGEGLSLPLHQFDVSLTPGETRALLATRPDPSEACRWTLRDLPADSGYAAALAVAETNGD
jgi:4'-phosphopantetheinyl transferase